MAIPHARPADPIDITALGKNLKNSQTTTLIKTDSLEVLRLVLPAGKEIDRHSVPGEITIQCLEGKTVVATEDSHTELTAGTLLFLNCSDGHALRAVEDSSLLVTILLSNKSEAKQ